MTWRWKDGELRDADGAGDVLASATPTALHCGKQEILLEAADGRSSCLRGTTSDGQMYYLTQPGFTNSRLDIDCNGRIYRAERIHPLRRSRRITRDGEELLRTEPASGNALTVWAPREGEAPSLPVTDAAFITWGCALADARGKIVRI